jgi:hypothetical protein
VDFECLPMWRNGRRNGLKIRSREKRGMGSTPIIGTSQNAVLLGIANATVALLPVLTCSLRKGGKIAGVMRFGHLSTYCVIRKLRFCSLSLSWRQLRFALASVGGSDGSNRSAQDVAAISGGNRSYRGSDLQLYVPSYDYDRAWRHR